MWLVLLLIGSSSAVQGMICSLSVVRSYKASWVVSLIRESGYRLMNMIKHLPLTFNRDLIKYNVLDCLCQSCEDSKGLLLQLLTRIKDSRNDIRNYSNGSYNADKISLSPFFLNWWWRLAIHSYIVNCFKKSLSLWLTLIKRDQLNPNPKSNPNPGWDCLPWEAKALKMPSCVFKALYPPSGVAFC